MRRLLCAIATALVCAAAASSEARPAPPDRAGPASKPPARSAARASGPEVRVTTLKQLDAALASYRGTGVVINFWAIWCEPCVAELPELVEVAREFRDKGAVVLTVSFDLMVPDVTREEVARQVRAFVGQRKIDLPVFIYDGPDYEAINRRFGLPGPVPVTVALDRNGALVGRHDGKAGKEHFRELLRKAAGR